MNECSLTLRRAALTVGLVVLPLVASSGAMAELIRLMAENAPGHSASPAPDAPAETQSVALDAPDAGDIDPVEPPAGPTVVKKRNFAGQSDDSAFLSDVALAAGPTRVIQLVNRRFAIYGRGSSKSPLSRGTLAAFVGFSEEDDVRHPQIIWDPATSRFYYAARASRKDGGISNNAKVMTAFGWSRTATPTSANDFCKYLLSENINDNFDFPLIGDNDKLLIIGSNVFNFNNQFYRAQISMIRKQAAGSTCPDGSTLTVGRETNLRDADQKPVFGPTPANSVETEDGGFSRGAVIARNGSLPSNKLWVFSVSDDPQFGPLVGFGQPLTLPFTYAAPRPATQPGFSQTIDTGSAFPTQAVLARNPRRNGNFSLWTQQTIAKGDVSAIRWYEIAPFGSSPTLLRQGEISERGAFLYNASIAPDRRVDGRKAMFGGSFVIQFNRSSASKRVAPQIRAGASKNGGRLTFKTVTQGVGGFRNSSCADAGSVCRWGTYSAAAPDPRPGTSGAGAVWISNQYSGVRNPAANRGNWRTRIFQLKP